MKLTLFRGTAEPCYELGAVSLRLLQPGGTPSVSTPEPSDDVAVVRQAYADHHEAVRAFARRLLGDDATAEDLVQESFVALPKALRSYRGEASLRTFILSLAVNRARHFARAAARRRRWEQAFGAEDAVEVQRPDAELEREQLARALFRALDRLPWEQRVAFVLCEIEERPSAEVSAIVNAPAATVRARVQLARKKLRETLEREGFR